MGGAVNQCADFASHTGYMFLGLHTPYFSIQLCRLSIFILLLTYVWRRRRVIMRKSECDDTAMPNGSFLLLPAYFDFLRFFIFYILVVTIANIAVGEIISPAGLAIQVGLFHFFYDGLWFFFAQYGAGSKAFARCFWFGLLSAIVTIVVFTVVARDMKFRDDGDWFPALLYYNLAYIVIFALPLVTPASYMYRRPPMVMYSSLMCLYHCLYVLFVVMIWRDDTSGYCIAITVYILFDCILKPLCVVLALAIDSAYWQGTNSDHPLAGIWNVDLRLASSIANVDTKHLTVPFIHFGLIQLDKDVGFVAGGFSRVYFGKIRNTKVALKMLFVIELTPESISDFCREAEIMYNFRHPNIISCLGVCIMPPAVSIALEYCDRGSLFDVLYKPRSNQSKIFGHSLRSTIFRSRILTQLSSNQSQSRHTLQSNPMSELDQLEMGSSRGSRARGFSDISTTSAGIENRKSNLNSTGPSASSSNENAPAARALLAESRAGHVGPWQSLSILCASADEHFPFDINTKLLDSRNISNTSASNGSMNPVHEGNVESGKSATTNDVPVEQGRKATVKRRSAQGSWLQQLRQKPYDMRASEVLPDPRDTVHAGVESMGGRFTSMFQKSSYTGSAPPSMSTKSAGRSMYEPSPRSETGAELHRTDIPLYLLDGLSIIHNLSIIGILEILCDITRGVAVLHQRDFKHCDIKSLNFLLTENYRVKLADMGETRPINTLIVGDSRPPIPAMNWCPPEVLHPGATSTSYTTASDVYGLCMVLSEVLLLSLPLEELRSTNKPTYEKWRKMLLSGVRPELSAHLPKQLRDILAAGWASDPLDRPTSENILEVLETILAVAENRISPPQEGITVEDQVSIMEEE